MFCEFNIVMIGSAESGKSSIVKRLKTGDFNKQYVKTLDLEVTPVIINTNYGLIQFNILDCAGQEQYSDANACIGVIENGNRQSVEYLKEALKNDIISNIPVVTVFNKTENKTSNKVYSFPEAIHVSAKHNKNLYEPLLILARELSGLKDLIFLESTPIPPPNATMYI
jgi:small GTP-binding protein